MVYRIREKFWSVGNEFTIADQHGHAVYQVKGKAFSWGDKLSFQNMRGEELAFIEQQMMSLQPRYRITRGGELFAEVVKEWSWFKRSFTLDVPGPNDYAIEGSFWEHEFSFTRAEGPVATVSKKHFSWTDSYGVEIVDGEDDVAILCACIVIDQVLHDQDS